MLSSKPYLIRALWSWCCDAGFTPYLTLFVDEQCRVPLEYVQDGTLTLNLSPAATGALDIGNEWILLSARFGGVSRELTFPVGAVTGIFARENGAGMEFAYEPSVVSAMPTESPNSGVPADEPATTPRPTKPHLHRVK
ncbi:MAG: ClpXP protease specificity-enhancing factor [Rhodocyclaceae bacterium]|nr:ClpXP protease specificity-enhancing factor [Rhodocyclaceae bacterium]